MRDGLARTPWGFRSSSGQALVETALIVPFLLMIALNTINFAYFFLVAVNLAAAPRSGALYSILGFQTPNSLSLAPPGQTAGCTTATSTSVSCLTLNDMTGALSNGGTTPVQVCTAYSGINADGTSVCTGYNNSPVYTPDVDMGSATSGFHLNRVDVTYAFTPLIPGTPFNIALLPASICNSNSGTFQCTFHRQAEMRVMN